MMRKIPIDIDEPLQPGDTVRLYYKRVFDRGSILAKGFSALIKRRLQNNPQYELVGFEYTDTSAIYTVKIKEPQSEVGVQQASVAGILMVLSVGLTALFIGWAFEKAEKGVETLGELTLKTIPLAVIVAIVIFLILKRR